MSGIFMKKKVKLYSHDRILCDPDSCAENYCFEFSLSPSTMYNYYFKKNYQDVFDAHMFLLIQLNEYFNDICIFYMETHF